MEEKEIKNESGNILTGQAGMKVTGWYEKICGERLLAGWRREGSSNYRKV